MIHPRAAIASHIRQFVDHELAGLYRFDDIEFMPAEKSAEYGHKARGQYREMAEVRFGPYNLTVALPGERPPLGHIELSVLGAKMTGPLDTETWKRIGGYIRDREFSSGQQWPAKKVNHG